MFTMGLIGKFVFGWLCDVFDNKLVMMFNLAVMLAGAVCLATVQASLLWPAVVLFGAGWGGLYTLLQVMTVDLFGLRAAGRILGTISVLDAMGGGLGPFITGLLFDRTGSYQAPFTMIAGLTLLALAATATLRPVAPRADSVPPPAA
jgi:MFS family permease